MNSITLSKVQSKRLLELAEYFFKEYNYVELVDLGVNYDKCEEFIHLETYKVKDLMTSPGYNRTLYNKIVAESTARFEGPNDLGYTWWHEDVVKKYADKYDVPSQPEVTMHWFGFTMIDLCNKLYSAAWECMGKEDRLWDIITKKGFYSQVLHHRTFHPVDYLYEQYLKLNNETK